jgi:methionine sulfoxide reductase heme-binding subunit
VCNDKFNSVWYISTMLLWQDRQGRFSPLRAGTLALGLLPAIVVGYWFVTHQLAPLDVKAALRLIGLWGMRFLVVALALTPLQRILNYPKLTLIRRMVGVTAFAYLFAHFILYIVNSKFDLVFVATEIVSRIYLTIGFVTLVGLGLLAGTSFDGAMRRMGPKWKMLHRGIYGLAVLGLLHYFIQTKIDVTPATLLAGIFLLLMTIRVLIARRVGLTAGALALTALAAGLMTAAMEFAWYALATGVDPWRIAKANLMLQFGLRPALMVVLAGLVPAAFVLIRSQLQSRNLPQRA